MSLFAAGAMRERRRPVVVPRSVVPSAASDVGP
jgi:hypothetical protein